MTAIDPTCRKSYPPNPHQGCVRVAGHEGRHVWVTDGDGVGYSVEAWRDHAADCTCAFCTRAAAAT